MSEIVERARNKSPYLKDSSAERLIDELVAEIERLTAENERLLVPLGLRNEIERLHAALQEIEHETGMTMLATNHGRRGDIANAIARRALPPGLRIRASARVPSSRRP